MGIAILVYKVFIYKHVNNILKHECFAVICELAEIYRKSDEIMTKNANPYWYKLIKVLKENKTISTGLTIPYIFGAYEILGQPFSDIEELINHILENPIDKYPLIQKCHVIEQDVLMVERKEYCNKYSKAIKFENNDRNNILFISPNTDLGKTLDKLNSNLTSLYLNPIKREHYSWDNKAKEWKKFSDKEIEIIKKLTN
ncbi:hypothetical protein [Flavobacterium sp. PL002]|uniref:hypothetical protein n=1 Tax=Flavobacterium sp. PL002 TaxID=1897058 RepID=UPI00178795F9|nr:hypothetical protein [Flavobacterium sp. PL002]MBE0391306.1 hypothetical protein [Flavobacterium sp. PL002]